MSNDKPKPETDPFKDYVPETVEYDPEVDGVMRDEILSEKERLKETITRLKEKNRGNRKVRR
jgi:hypothetical protein